MWQGWLFLLWIAEFHPTALGISPTKTTVSGRGSLSSTRVAPSWAARHDSDELSPLPIPSTDTLLEEASSSTSCLPLRPLILGGGLAGLATALAFVTLDQHPHGDDDGSSDDARKTTTRAVAHVQILEASSDAAWRDPTAGAGAQLGPNGLRALRALVGTASCDRIRQAGTALEGNVLTLPGGQAMVVPDTAHADTGLSQIFVRWGILRQALQDALVPHNSVNKNDNRPETTTTTNAPDRVPVAIRTSAGRNVAGYRQLPNGFLQLVDSQGQDLDHDPCNLIVGAEGAASTLRYLVNTQQMSVPDALSPQQAARHHLKYTGRINYKAIVDKPLDDYAIANFQPNHTYGWFAQSGGVACFCGPAGPGHSYWAVSVVDEHNGETGFQCQSQKLVFEALLTMLRGLGSDEDSDPSSRCPSYMLDLIAETEPNRLRATPSEETTGVGPSLVNCQ
jgi:2-polyprenyl-6-methoxyphenol hydroxylase-like FAD-dependent oxidoreductase